MRRSSLPPYQRLVVLAYGMVAIGLAGCGTIAGPGDGPEEPTSASTAGGAETPSERPPETASADAGRAALGAGLPTWMSLRSVLPRVPGEAAYDFRLPVIDDANAEASWPTFGPDGAPSVAKPLGDVFADDLRQPLPASYDPASCPTLEQIVGPTIRKDERGALEDRFLYAGQVIGARLWWEYPETLYDVAVIAPFAGTPSETGTPWYQFLRANGDPLGLSGEPSGYGFALEPGVVLLIGQTSQNSPNANAYPDQLPYTLVDGWWEPMDPALVRNPPVEPQLDRFPVGCLEVPTA